MIRKRFFWVGPLVLGGLISVGIAPADAAGATRAKSTKSAAARRPVYSAARAQTRKAKLARARAVAMAREMADTVLPRYKVDASGDLVPDVRAAAALSEAMSRRCRRSSAVTLSFERRNVVEA